MSEIERFDSNMRGKTAHEHFHRYGLCKEYVNGKIVLDLASGEGYGTAILGENAQSVIGLDLSIESVKASQRKYSRDGKIGFQQGDCRFLPFSPASFDVIVALEIIEHISEQDQVRALSEIARVLKPDGLLIISTPNREIYNRYKQPNRFHIREFETGEFSDFLNSRFSYVEILGQTLSIASIIGPLRDTSASNDASYRAYTNAYLGPARIATVSAGINVIAEPEYCLAFCSNEPIVHPVGKSSLYQSADDDLWAEHSKVMAWASNLHNEDEELRALVGNLNSGIDDLHRQNADHVRAISNLNVRLSHAQELVSLRDAEVNRLWEMTNKLNDMEGKLKAADAVQERSRIQAIAGLLGPIVDQQIGASTYEELIEAFAEASTAKARQKVEFENLVTRLQEAETASSRLRAQISDARASAAELTALLGLKEKDLAAKTADIQALQLKLRENTDKLLGMKADLEIGKRAISELSNVNSRLEDMKKGQGLHELRERIQKEIVDAGRVVRKVLAVDSNNRSSHQRKFSLPDLMLVKRLGLFDAEWYAAQDEHIPVGGAWAHFKRYGANEGRDPHPLFNGSWFAMRYPDKATKVPPLLAYIRSNDIDRLSPHPLFDVDYYLATNPDVAADGMGPLKHYIKYGQAEGRSPSPLILPSWIERKWSGKFPQPFSLREYLLDSNLWRLSTHPLFDAVYYLDTNPDLHGKNLVPLVHYLVFGWREGRSPHPCFNNDWYLQRNPDVLQARVNPLVHYVRYGAAEDRDPNPLFDTRFYLEANPDVATSGMNPFAHFIAYGQGEGRASYRKKSDARLSSVLTSSGRKPPNLMKLLLDPDESLDPLKIELSPTATLSNVNRAIWPPTSLGDYWPPQRLRDYILEGLGEDYLPLNSYLFSVIDRYKDAPEEFVNSADKKLLMERINFLNLRRQMLHAGSVVASVVIPVYNNFLDTVICVASLLETDSRCNYEIIIADDCSTDATSIEFSRLGGIVRHVRQGTNRGFLANCNAAAEVANGQFFVFLNNDTVVLQQWLDNLIKTFSLKDKVGLAGSKLLNWDGTLQEAGGIFWKDGSAWNFGRNQDPRKAEFNYLREVDYCSGASIAVPADIWRQLGGFDPIYSPAYCEDSDLAFRIRNAGYKVVYQPHSELVHHEGRSHGRDLNSGIKAYQVKNQETLKRRWSSVLDAEHYDNGKMLASARDKSRNKPHVLIIDHYIPQWEHDAGSRTMYHYIRMFVEKGFQVTFWPDNLWQDPEYTPRLQEMGVEVIYGAPYLNTFETWLNEDGRKFDYILLSRPHIAIKYLSTAKRSGSTLLYYGHDLHFLRMQAQYDLEPIDGLAEAIEKMTEEELRLCADVDVFLYPSQEEIDAVKARIGNAGTGYAIPMNIFEIDELQQNDGRLLAGRSKTKILFVGGFSHSPNVDGLRWFVEKVLPLLRSKGDYDLSVVGSNPPEEITALESADVHILGRVTDAVLDQLYAECAVAIAPLRFGGGVKGKVIEAMSKGVPLVTTSTGVQGISDAGKLIAIADDAEAFAHEVWSTAQHSDGVRDRVASSLDYIRQHYTLPAAVSRLANFIPELR